MNSSRVKDYTLKSVKRPLGRCDKKPSADHPKLSQVMAEFENDGSDSELERDELKAP